MALTWRPSTAVWPYVGLILLGLSLLHAHITGVGTFIGDSDRLNTFLNIREFQVASIQQHGFVPAWSDAMFMGFSTASIYWMLPIADPIAYVESLFPLRDLFVVSGFVSSALLIGAACAAYVFFRALSGNRLAAFVGAALYVSSAFSIGRITQVDPAYAVLIYAPLGLLAIRQTTERRWTGPFVGLTLVLTALLWTTFLQDAAYIFILLGAYTLFRALTLRSAVPLIIGIAAVMISGVSAAPRVYNIFQDNQLVSRTPVNTVPCPCELLRWVDDGVYGRFPEEVAALKNGINLHEGAQIYTATFTPMLILVSALSMRGPIGAGAAGLFFVTLGVVASPLISDTRAIILSLSLFAVWTARALLRRTRPAPDPTGSIDADAPFYLAFIGVGLAVILWPPARDLLQRVFFGLDFNHSRISSATVLSINALVCVSLARRLPASRGSNRSSIAQFAAAACGAVAIVWLVNVLANGPALAWSGIDVAPRLGVWINVSPVEIVRIALWVCVFVILLVLARVARLQRFAGYALACAMVTQGFQYAELQLDGAQDLSYPAPFRENNYFVAPGFALRPPSPDAVERVRQRLKTDDYRSVIMSAADGFPTFDAPSEHGYTAYLAQAWRLRLVEGYPTLPTRLAALPWPPLALSLRSLSFRPETQLPWPLLASLNVKYVVTVNPALYFNLGTRGEAAPDDLLVEENPLPVTPRQFFAASVRPYVKTQPAADAPAASTPAATRPLLPQLAPPAIERVSASSATNAEVTWTGDTPATSFRIEYRQMPQSAWTGFVTADASARSASIDGLQPLNTYEVRMQACTADGCSVYSEAARVGMPSSLAGAELRGVVPEDPTRESVVEGLSETATYATEGHIEARYVQDRVDISVDPSAAPRFLVLNEMYHPNWKAYADGRELTVYPTNVVMRGLVVPPGVSKIQMVFTPFVLQPLTAVFMACSVGLLLGAVLLLRRVTKSHFLGSLDG
jgi:hypothetical protein